MCALMPATGQHHAALSSRGWSCALGARACKYRFSMFTTVYNMMAIFVQEHNILRTNYGPTSHDVTAQFRSRTWVVKHGSLSPSWVGVRPYNSSRIVRKALIRTWSSIRCTSPRSCFTTYFFARGLFFFRSLGDTKCGGGIGFAPAGRLQGAAKCFRAVNFTLSPSWLVNQIFSTKLMVSTKKISPDCWCVNQNPVQSSRINHQMGSFGWLVSQFRLFWVDESTRRHQQMVD